MTNTHIDKEAREAILFLARQFDGQFDDSLEERIVQMFTPLPADVESSPKPEGLKWDCKMVQSEDGDHDIMSPTGKYFFAAGVSEWALCDVFAPGVGSLRKHEHAKAIAALNACTTPPPDWQPHSSATSPSASHDNGEKVGDDKPEAGEQRVAVARVDPPDGARPYRHLTRLSDLHDVPDGTLLYAETAPLPTPQPAEPKVMPWPEDLTTLIGKSITAQASGWESRFKDTVIGINTNVVMGPHINLKVHPSITTGWNLLYVEEVHPPQPSEQAKGAEPSPMAKKLTNKLWLSHLGMDVIRNYALEIDAAFAAEMEAVKKGASRD